MIAAQSSEGAANRAIANRKIEMARRILEFIEREYPGFIWTVKVNLDGKHQGAAISLPVLLPPHTYNVVPARFLCTENAMKRRCLDAAGNLLERYKVPRSSMKMAEIAFLEARAKVHRKSIIPA
jgi:hypothetical protein